METSYSYSYYYYYYYYYYYSYLLLIIIGVHGCVAHREVAFVMKQTEMQDVSATFQAVMNSMFTAPASMCWKGD